MITTINKIIVPVTDKMNVCLKIKCLQNIFFNNQVYNTMYYIVFQKFEYIISDIFLLVKLNECNDEEPCKKGEKTTYKRLIVSQRQY